MWIPFSAALHSGAQSLSQYFKPAASDPAQDLPDGVAFTGRGALEGQQIAVPLSGESPEAGDVARLPPQVQQALQQSGGDGRAQMQTRLEPAADLSPLYVPRPLSLAANGRVIEMLQAHALAAGSVLSSDQIAGYVALGEHALHAIAQIRSPQGQESAPMPTQLPVAGGLFLSANQEVMRAISWYVVACAAQQDVNRQAEGITHQIDGKTITDLTIAGAYVFKDTHHAIYDFMNHYPAVYSRISTHFNERSDSALLAYGNAVQRGIEDYQQRLPGEGGTILFDKLKGGEIFFKFEHSGMPTMASAGKVDDQGQGGAGSYGVAQRVGSHSLSFLWTRMYPSPGVERKEHVYKGLLENAVHRPFLVLVRQAQSLGLLEAQGTPDQYAKQSKNQGLPYLEQVLDQLEAKLTEAEPTPEQEELRQSLMALQSRIFGVKDTLGAQSNHLGIVRRGAETHVDLNPANLDLQRAQQGFVRPGGTSNAELPSLTRLEEICDGDAAAASWLSRFASQMSAAPLRDYLRNELLGAAGSGVELIGGTETLAIAREAQGVELQWDFAYRKQDDVPLQIRRKDTLWTMRDDATLEASIRLRFEGLDAFDAGRPPVPAVIQPLACSVQNFELAQVFDQEFDAEVIDPD